MAWIDDSLQAKKVLAGKKIVITAGGTISPLDPVRFWVTVRVVRWE